MKTILTFPLLIFIILVHSSAYGQVQANLLLKGQPFEGKTFRVPESNWSIKTLGSNITDITLNTILYYIPRNEPATVLSYTVKDSGNYLVIWKLKARDTTTFYPNNPEALAIDSSASAWLSLNGESTGMPKDILLRQFAQAADSINDKLSFLSIPLDHSEVMHLNTNDTLSLTVSLYGVLKLGLEKQGILPIRLLTTCVINNAEMILIKIANKD